MPKPQSILNLHPLHTLQYRRSLLFLQSVSESTPHPCFRCSSLGQRTSTILKHIFPVPKAESKRIMTFANRSECIQFRHHLYRYASRGLFIYPICSGSIVYPRCSACVSCSRQKGRGKRPRVEGIGAAFRYEALPDQAGYHGAAGARAA